MADFVIQPQLHPDTVTVQAVQLDVCNLLTGRDAEADVLLSIAARHRAVFVANAGARDSARVATATDAIQAWQRDGWGAVAGAAAAATSKAPLIFAWGDVGIPGLFTRYCSSAVPFETAMLETATAVLHVGSAANLLSTGAPAREAGTHLANASRAVTRAHAAMQTWTDAGARTRAPAVLQPGGLDALGEWVAAWRAVAYAVAASQKNFHTTAAQAYITAQQAANRAVAHAARLPAPSWRSAVQELAVECEAAAAAAAASAFQAQAKHKTKAETIGHLLAWLGTIKWPERCREAAEEKIRGLNLENNTLYCTPISQDASVGRPGPFAMPPVPPAAAVEPAFQLA